MNGTDKRLLSLNSRVRHRKVGDEGVVVCMHSGNVLVINEVGAHILEQLQHPQNFDSVLQSVSDTFDVGEEQAKQDIEGYLAELEEQEVVILSAAELSEPSMLSEDV